MSVSIRLSLRKAGTFEAHKVTRLFSAIGHPLFCSYCTGGKALSRDAYAVGYGIYLGFHTRCGSARIAPLLQGFRFLGLSFGEGDEKRGDR